LEKRIYRYPYARLVPYIVNAQLLEIVIQSIIKYKFHKEYIFKIDNKESAKKFKLLVGNERVTSTDLVTKLLNIQLENMKDGAVKSNIKVLDMPLKFHDFYNRLTDFRKVKEPLATTYLQAMGFIEIIRSISDIK
jgi:hypothetical protein